MRKFVVVLSFLLATAGVAHVADAAAEAVDLASFAYVTAEDHNGTASFGVYLSGFDWDRPLSPLDSQDAMDPSWSPDGLMITFAGVERVCPDSCASDIWVAESDSTHLRNLTDDSATNAMPAWSPDGTEIVYVRSPGEMGSALYLVDVDGGEPVRLSSVPGSYADPAWSPDGTKIAFGRAVAGSLPDIWVKDLVDGSETNLTNLPEANDQGPAWSPDGLTLAFGSDRAGVSSSSEIYAMASDGSNVRPLTATPLRGEMQPDWSPDGTKIMYSSRLNGDAALMMMDADGSDFAIVFDEPGTHMQPVWRPHVPLGRIERPGGSFYDDNGNVHEANIEAIAAAGITRGCNPPVNDEYCADQAVTRGQMAAFLNRALALDPTVVDFFTDDDDLEFQWDINPLAAAGITRGCNPPQNDRFCPHDPVTRGQMAAFLVRALAYTDAGAGDFFVDDDSSVFEHDIDRLATSGVTLGCNPPVNDRYCPRSVVSRAQMASFLTRALGLVPIVPPPALTLRTGGIGDFHLGDRADEVVAGLVAALGPPAFDELQQPPDSPRPYGFGADDYFRLVQWNRPILSVVFSDAAYFRADGEPHLIRVAVGDTDGGAVVSTDAGIRVGDSFADLQAVYGAQLSVVPDVGCMPEWGFVIATGAADTRLEVQGVLSGNPAMGDQFVTQLMTGAVASC